MDQSISQPFQTHQNQQATNQAEPPQPPARNLQQQNRASPLCHAQITTQAQFDTLEAVLDNLVALARETLDADRWVQACTDSQQDLAIHLQTRSRYVNAIYHAKNNQPLAEGYNLERFERELAIIDGSLRTKGQELNHVRTRLISILSNLFDRVVHLQSMILHTYLPRWQLEQQLKNQGPQGQIDMIQNCVGKIVDIIWKIKNQIKGLQLTLAEKNNVPFKSHELELLVARIDQALETLILNTLVVEKQPPQVMKTNTRFTATVRYLIANKLNVQLLSPTVTVSILSEQNARTVISYHKHLIQSSWTPEQPASVQELDAVMDGDCLKIISQSGCSQPQDSQPIATAQSNNGHAQIWHAKATDGHNGEHYYQRRQQQPHHNHSGSYVQLQQRQSISATLADYDGPESLDQLASKSSPVEHKEYGFVLEIGYNPLFPIRSRDFETSGEILNNNAILEFHETSSQMICHFKAMQLKKIKRTEKKGTESVTDEKFVLLFSTRLRIADDSFWSYSSNGSRAKRGDKVYHILALSLPVVVIVHGNQESHAWATVTWHNAFATQDQILYRVPDRVTWSELGGVLNDKFRMAAGRGLSARNLTHLASKVTRNPHIRDSVIVSWNQFAKEPLLDKSFTFWEWFHSIIKLTKDYLSRLWEANLIYGFVGKQGCDDLLLGSHFGEPCPIGTFLLRFSEGEKGAISIAWVSKERKVSSPTQTDGVQAPQAESPSSIETKRIVEHLSPFTAKDLHTRSLADRIRDLPELTQLYPAIPKHEAFQPFYTPMSQLTPKSVEGYVRSLLVTTLAENYPIGQSDLALESQPCVRTSIYVDNGTLNEHSNDPLNDSMDTSFNPYDPSGNDFDYNFQ